jgi:hypothetical protein
MPGRTSHEPRATKPVLRFCSPCFFSYTLGMRTNRIICVNCEDSACSEQGRTGVSRESCARFVACATSDNIANPPATRSGRMNIEILKIDETCRAARLLSTPDSALVLDEPTKNRYYRLVTRMWRNWQTHRLQVPAGLGPWRFDSSHPHYLAINSRGFSALTVDLTKGPYRADKYLG